MEGRKERGRVRGREGKREGGKEGGRVSGRDEILLVTVLPGHVEIPVNSAYMIHESSCINNPLCFAILESNSKVIGGRGKGGMMRVMGV